MQHKQNKSKRGMWLIVRYTYGGRRVDYGGARECMIT